MESPKAIYGAIASIMNETKAIVKSEFNKEQKFKFRSIDNVMNELHDIFAKHNVFIIPEVLDYRISEKPTRSGSVLYYTRATIRHRFTTIDGSEVTTTTVGEAMDAGDKGMNKAMSIALKYALLQMLLIPTIENKDPDGTIPPETRPKTVSEYIDEAIAELDANVNFLLVAALGDIKEAATIEDLKNIYNNNKLLTSDPTFTRFMTAKKKEIKQNGTA